MPETSSLALPLLVAEQAQKHVTHNEALRALDAIVQLAVLDRDLTSPPGDPEDGDRYIVAASATDEWADHDDEIVAWQDGAWAFYPPATGWRAWADDESLLLVWTGAAWEDYSALVSALQNLTLLGIGTIADGTNPLSAKLNNILFTAKYDGEGGDGSLRTKMNKEAAADVLSLLLQTDFSGRAEIGLIGDDDLHFKVSPDGSAWVEALRIDKDNGALLLGAPEGPVITHDPSADANDGGYKFRFSYKNTDFSNGPGGEENYVDDTWGIGVNYAEAGGARIDDTKAAIGWTFESKYYQGSDFGVEAQLRMIDTAGVQHRPFSGFWPHDGSAGSDIQLEADAVYLEEFGNPSTVKIKFDLANDVTHLYESHVLYSRTNNVGWLRQANAAGSSYKSLLKLNASDVAEVGAPLKITDARNAANGRFVEVLPTSADANDIGLYVSMPTLTGALYPVNFQGNASSGVLCVLAQNNNTTSTSAHARAGIAVNGAGAGDPYFRIEVIGVTQYCVGIDNSDGDKFKISASSGIGTNDRLAIDGNAAAFGVPAKVPTFTVGTVPSASTAGAGAIVYVSDESGGAVLAFSDATNWRRVTDRAVVS